ncbi:hypothetical protein BJ085DRAFT_36062 [Dimargaris cristalligena]|uniref:Uncharacterized protein n=1 Tax=Dimargaris cristalligena TaxID=215637 RepID=A0A4P9ZYY2_9FUNG|nr:hypothetical protein BJ085DRAFT_36062 [Dimargaris cristalligena]|eukprot:RKP38000.1 hypothetical protein BJ085DRAFT_36062 [Dimargaris cristalligena]
MRHFSTAPLFLAIVGLGGFYDQSRVYVFSSPSEPAEPVLPPSLDGFEMCTLNYQIRHNYNAIFGAGTLEESSNPLSMLEMELIHRLNSAKAKKAHDDLDNSWKLLKSMDVSDNSYISYNAAFPPYLMNYMNQPPGLGTSCPQPPTNTPQPQLQIQRQRQNQHQADPQTTQALSEGARIGNTGAGITHSIPAENLNSAKNGGQYQLQPEFQPPPEQSWPLEDYLDFGDDTLAGILSSFSSQPLGEAQTTAVPNVSVSTPPALEGSPMTTGFEQQVLGKGKGRSNPLTKVTPTYRSASPATSSVYTGSGTIPSYSVSSSILRIPSPELSSSKSTLESTTNQYSSTRPLGNGNGLGLDTMGKGSYQFNPIDASWVPGVDINNPPALGGNYLHPSTANNNNLPHNKGTAYQYGSSTPSSNSISSRSYYSSGSGSGSGSGGLNQGKLPAVQTEVQQQQPQSLLQPLNNPPNPTPDYLSNTAVSVPPKRRRPKVTSKTHPEAEYQPSIPTLQNPIPKRVRKPRAAAKQLPVYMDAVPESTAAPIPIQRYKLTPLPVSTPPEGTDFSDTQTVSITSKLNRWMAGLEVNAPEDMELTTPAVREAVPSLMNRSESTKRAKMAHDSTPRKDVGFATAPSASFSSALLVPPTSPYPRHVSSGSPFPAPSDDFAGTAQRGNPLELIESGINTGNQWYAEDLRDSTLKQVIPDPGRESRACQFYVKQVRAGDRAKQNILLRSFWAQSSPSGSSNQPRMTGAAKGGEGIHYDMVYFPQLDTPQTETDLQAWCSAHYKSRIRLVNMDNRIDMMALSYVLENYSPEGWLESHKEYMDAINRVLN